jgi:hypothetical protein
MSFEFTFRLSSEKTINVSIEGLQNTNLCKVSLRTNSVKKFKKVPLEEVKNFIAVQLYKSLDFSFKYKIFKFTPKYESKNLEYSIDKLCKKNGIKVIPENHSYDEDDFHVLEDHKYSFRKVDEMFPNGVRYLYLNEIDKIVDTIFSFLLPMKKYKDEYDILDMVNGLEKHL